MLGEEAIGMLEGQGRLGAMQAKKEQYKLPGRSGGFGSVIGGLATMKRNLD
jgi:hypothetical protein